MTTRSLLPFLDTLVTKDSDGVLTTGVYRKLTHTDQYLAYDSHHPQSVKRGIVKCLDDRAKHQQQKEEPTQDFNSTAALPYIKGVSEVLRRCQQQQGCADCFQIAHNA